MLEGIFKNTMEDSSRKSYIEYNYDIDRNYITKGDIVRLSNERYSDYIKWGMVVEVYDYANECIYHNVLLLNEEDYGRAYYAERANMVDIERDFLLQVRNEQSQLVIYEK